MLGVLRIGSNNSKSSADRHPHRKSRKWKRNARQRGSLAYGTATKGAGKSLNAQQEMYILARLICLLKPTRNAAIREAN